MKKKIGDCDKCGKPVFEGDARYAALLPPKVRHAACHDWRKPADVFAEMKEKIAKIKRP